MADEIMSMPGIVRKYDAERQPKTVKHTAVYAVGEIDDSAGILIDLQAAASGAINIPMKLAMEQLERELPFWARREYVFATSDFDRFSLDG